MNIVLYTNCAGGVLNVQMCNTIFFIEFSQWVFYRNPFRAQVARE